MPELAIKLRADTAEFASDMGRAAHISERELERIATRAAVMGEVIGRGFTIVARHVATTIENAVKAGDAIGKMSERVGVSTETLGGLEFAGKLADVSIRSLEVGMKSLATNMLNTQAGTGKAQDAFKALGFQVEATKGVLKPTDQVIFELADKFARMEDGAAKTALAIRIFGREGEQLIPLLNQGAAGLRENAEEARRFGLIISSDAARAAQVFNDNLTRLQQSSRGAGIALANSVIPAMNTYLEQLLEGKRIAGGFVEGMRLFGLSSITSSNAAEKIREINTELARLNTMLRTEWTGGGIEGRIADLKKQAEFAKFLQRQDALELGRVAGGDTAGERARMGSGRLKAPVLPDEGAAKQAAEIAKRYAEISRIAASIDVTVPFIKDRDQLEAIGKLVTEGRKDWVAYADAVFAAADAENTANASGESYTQMAEKLREKVLDLIDPLRQVAREHQKLDELVATGWLSESDARIAKLAPDIRALLQPLSNIQNEIQKAWETGLLTTEEMDKALGRLNDRFADGKGSADSFGRSFERVFDRAGEAFAEFATTGKLNFTSLMDSIIADLTRAMIQMQIMIPLKEALGLAGGGGGGGGGLFSGLSGLFGGGGAAAGGTASMAAASASEGFIEGLLLGAFAEGTPYVPQTGPYLLHKGEAVVPAAENVHARGGRGVMIVNNNHYNIDSRSDRSEIMMLIEARSRESERRVADQARRGGGYSNAIRGR